MKTIIIALIALLLAPVALAADGDDCGLPLNNKGMWKYEKCLLICDDFETTPGACTVFDTDLFGMSDVLMIDMEDTTGNCTGQPQATITTSHYASGSPANDINTTAVVIDDDPERVVIDTSGAIVNRYLVATMGGVLTGCDGLDVRIFFGNRKN